MKSTVFAAAVAAAALAAGGSQAAGNLITNGSFEIGPTYQDQVATGWTATGATPQFVATSGYDGYTAEDGDNFWAMGGVGSDGFLSQTFADTPGVVYEASFWFNSNGTTPNDFGVTGPGGLSLATMSDIPSTNGWINYYGFFDGSGSDTITFNGRDDPAYLALDNVSVTSTVPEPAAWASMILGFGLAGAAVRRRKALAAV